MDNQHTLPPDTSTLPKNGHPKTIMLSTNTTLFWRVFVPVFSTVFIGGFVVAFWLTDIDELYLPMDALWVRAASLLVLGAITVLMGMLADLVSANRKLAEATLEKLRKLEERLAHYAKPKLLIVDELGYLPFEPNAAHLFFQLVSRRYERGSLLVTSNRAAGEWGIVFGDPVVATAILDRLLHHSHVITIRGDSYRLREKRRAGVIPKSEGAPVRKGPTT